MENFTWKIVVLVSIIVISMSSCFVAITETNNKAVIEMVKNGSDAISAGCAVDRTTREICLVAAAKGDK